MDNNFATSAESSSTQTRSKVVFWLTIFAFGLAACFTIDGPVTKWIHENYNYRTRPVPTMLRPVTKILRSMENWGENVFIVAIVFAMWQLDKTRRSRILLIGISSIVVVLGVESVKRLTGRERPEVSQCETRFHGPSFTRARGDDGDYESFPSGHVASAAVYSGALSNFYPPLKPVCIVMVLGCSANRIWKERHFPSDCWVAGFFGFWFAGTLARRRWVQPITAWFDRKFSAPTAKTVEPITTNERIAKAA